MGYLWESNKMRVEREDTDQTMKDFHSEGKQGMLKDFKQGSNLVKFVFLESIFWELYQGTVRLEEDLSGGFAVVQVRDDGGLRCDIGNGENQGDFRDSKKSQKPL